MDSLQNNLCKQIFSDLIETLVNENVLKTHGFNWEGRQIFIRKMTEIFLNAFKMDIDSTRFKQFSASVDSCFDKNERLTIRIKSTLARLLAQYSVFVNMLSDAVNDDIIAINGKRKKSDKKIPEENNSDYNVIGLVVCKLEKIKNNNHLTRACVDYCNDIYEIFLNGSQVSNLKRYGCQKNIDSIDEVILALKSILNAHKRDPLMEHLNEINTILNGDGFEVPMPKPTKVNAHQSKNVDNDNEKLELLPKKAVKVSRESERPPYRSVDNMLTKNEPKKELEETSAPKLSDLNEASRTNLIVAIINDINSLNAVNFRNESMCISSPGAYTNIDLVFKNLKTIKETKFIDPDREFFCFNVFEIFHNGSNVAEWLKSNKKHTVVEEVLKELLNAINQIQDDCMGFLLPTVKRKLNDKYTIMNIMVSPPVATSPSIQAISQEFRSPASRISAREDLIHNHIDGFNSDLCNAIKLDSELVNEENQVYGIDSFEIKEIINREHVLEVFNHVKKLNYIPETEASYFLNIFKIFHNGPCVSQSQLTSNSLNQKREILQKLKETLDSVDNNFLNYNLRDVKETLSLGQY